MTKLLQNNNALSKDNDIDINNDHEVNLDSLAGTGDLIDNSIFSVTPLPVIIEEAKSLPEPQKLIGDFWHQGEIGILFADTGKGKTIFALQTAEIIASGQQIGGFESEVEPQDIVYVDMEMSEKQLQVRNTNKQTGNTYKFSGKIHRASLDLKKIEDHLTPISVLNELEKMLLTLSKNVNIVIIDNITYLVDEMEKSKNAAPLMKELKAIKDQFNLSILLIAHTPKLDSAYPITVNSLQGSKMFSNFADSIFAIGESHKDPNLVYLKQIKVRTGVKNEDVMVCERKQDDNGLLYLNFLRNDLEGNLLKISDKQERNQKILELHKQGMSYRNIAEQLGIGHGTVGNVIKLAKTYKND